jgi:hypothetical protein
MLISPEMNEVGRSRALPITLTIFALIAVFTGLLKPGEGDSRAPPPVPTEQAELQRGDAAAGFPAPPQPDNPPRGPGEG